MGDLALVFLQLLPDIQIQKIRMTVTSQRSNSNDNVGLEYN